LYVDERKHSMAKTQTSCPRCRQPVVADVEQLFDVGNDPQAKQRFLSGQFNLIQCQNCGYTGNMSTPLVYHDPGKELLLTYFPPELGLPVNEQERLIGPMINQVVNRLPNEKRKAYLLRPRSMFTLQTMIETVLQADGITKEMLDAQQKRLALLQRLMSTSAPDARVQIIKQEEALIDESFFSILSRLVEASMAQGDQQVARALAVIQQDALNNTQAGQSLKSQAKETEDAIKALQEASQKGLTREKLLDMLAESNNDTRLTTLVSMARSGLDYQFFQMLSERIDKAAPEKKQQLTDLRDKLLKLTQEIDKAVQAQYSVARDMLEKILAAPDVRKATEESLDQISDLFVEVVDTEIKLARQKADLGRSGKLQTIMNVIQEASAPPPEVEFINELVEAESDEERQRILNEHADMITPELLGVMNNLVAQMDQQNQPPEVKDQIDKAYRAALRFSMQASLKK
jgi:hypothetical protein